CTAVPPCTAAPPPAAPGIRELAALLRAAGLDPSAEELADALWLAGHIRGPGPARPPDHGPDPETDPADPSAEPVEPLRADADTDDPVRLYAPGAHPAGGAEDETPEESPDDHGIPVRVPGAAALPRILDVQRALRALQ
ncbi:hypothetical protein SIN09_37945, partial [Streptomyces sp. F8]|nr:hypothetical protein [Streptomyces sp. F8]